MPTDTPSPDESLQQGATPGESAGLAQDGPLTGAIADESVERIIPPEQPPMDDAAGGPQAEDPDAPVDDVPTEGGAAAKESEAHPS